MKLPVTLFALLATAALIIGACSGNDADESAPVEASELTLDDRAYLGEIEQAFGRSDANFEKFNAALARSFASPEAILSALVEAGAGTTFDPVLDALKEIEPTERFVEDHRIIVEGVASMVEADQGIGAAAADGDIAGFELGNVNLALAGGAMRLELSSEACNALPAQGALCAPDFELPGGEYGAALNDAMRGLAAELLPRVGVLQESPQGPFSALTYLLLYSPEELVALYGAVDADTMAVLADAASAVNDLDPPDDFKTDHERLQAWFDETTDILEALFLATGEDDKSERERLQAQFMSGLCSALDGFSFEANALVGVFFAPAAGGAPEDEFCP
ncbi:MAG: hypothetical protein IIB18_03220 [Chloroflexi bacterium]|nr:hypothetical protein [Chloroflexota bacterium]